MRYCKNCGLKFDGLQEKCIFCNGHLEEVNKEISSTFSSIKPKSYYLDRIKKIIAFCLIVALVAAIFIEKYLFDNRHYWILTLFSSVYVYLVSSVSLNLSKGVAAKILNISFLTSLEVVGVFYFFDEFNVEGIVLSYIYPGIILLSFIGIGITILATKGKKIHDQLVYVLLNVLWGLTPIITLVAKLVNPTYISSMCVAISSLIALGFILFVDKDTKDELNRRLHF